MIEHIQINDVAPRIHYDADGVQSAFTYPFAIFKASDLEVWQGDMRQSANFTVSGVGISTGGTVLFALPPPAGTRVTLHRRLTLERISDYQADGIIRAKTLNDELDYQVAALQQVAEDVGRALKLAPTSSSSVDLTLPEPAAGRGLKWNPAGSALVNSDHDPDTLGNAVQAAADAQAAAAAAGAARDQAMAAAGSVKVSANDTTLAQLATKLVAGTGITVTELDDGGDERLSIASTIVVPQAITDRLNFLERNLAITVLRDQIDTGWSVLKMVDGIADEFEDETGLSVKTGATYDAVGDCYHNPGGYSADRCTGGSASSTGGVAANAFDNDALTVCGHSSAFDLQYDFASAQSDIIQYTITAGGSGSGYDGSHAPRTITASYWNGSSWVTADSQSGLSWTSGEKKTFTLPSAIPSLTKMKFALSNPSGGASMGVVKVEVMAHDLSPDMVLVSVARAAEAQPVEGRLVLLHQPVAAITPNTDLIAEISRDGGTTWTAAPLTDEGAFDGTTRVLAATADVSAQPAGTAMSWRLSTLNNKEQRLHGVWLQWR